MKTITLILLCCIATLASQAQWSKNHKSNNKHFFYTSGQFIMGESNGGDLGLNYVYNNKLTISFGYSATGKSNSTLPDEYLKSGTDYIPTNSVEPFQNFEDFHLMIGRAFRLNKKSSIRLLLQGGPGITTSREPEFTINGNQYDYQMQSSKKISLVLNPKIELPLCCTVGCSVGPMIIVNGTQQYIGAGIGIMYGVVSR